MLPLFLLSLLLQLVSFVESRSPYTEHLHLKPLPHSLLAQFEFSSNASSSSIEAQNFRFFPRSLSQILTYAHTHELHMRFTSGRWDEESWGPRPRNGAREGGTGIEMWAWVEGDTREVAFQRWLTLVNSLSGLFCASLNYIDSTRTTMPVNAFEPEGAESSNGQKLHLLHGALPREVVCTENLTPFMKLLPCKGKAGVSSLLDGHKIFDAAWQSMAIDVRPVCPQGSTGAECVLEMQQSIDMVLDLERSMRSSSDPIPRPLPEDQMKCQESKWYNQYGDSCYPADSAQFPEFNLERVFGRKVKGTCPLVDDGKDEPASLCIAPASGQAIDIKSVKSFAEHTIDGQRCFRMPVGGDFDIDVRELVGTAHFSPALPKLRVERTISGHGQQKGGLKSVITNPLEQAVDFVYMESLPWFVKPYIHTLQTAVQSQHSLDPALDDDVLKDIHYQPSIDRRRAAHLELKLHLQPKSTLALSYDFEKSVLRYTEYPPDANRGFDISPAIIRILPNAATGEASQYLRSTSLLSYAASPDFSMPYNVIILTSTVIALGFGSIFNLLVRRLVGAHEVQRRAGLAARLRSRVAAIKARFASKTKTQ